MMRALTHVGLSLVILVAPALCCCNLRWMAAAGELAHCPTCPPPAPTPSTDSCCKKSCCHETAPPPTPTAPTKAPAPSCCCTAERPVAANTVSKPDVPAAEFTGEILALAHVPALAPEHTRLASGLDPPERAGVDARYAALFDRHVLRC
jgi:hypothetical protein